MAATSVEPAEDLDAIHPELWPGRVTVHTADRTFTRYGEHIKGERSNPMSWDDVRNKLGELAPRHSAATLDDVVEAVRTIEDRTIHDVIAPLRT
jgi:2-methylcitrate dehydratase PrpD